MAYSVIVSPRAQIEIAETLQKGHNSKFMFINMPSVFQSR